MNVSTRLVESLLTEGSMKYTPGGVPPGTDCYYDHSGKDVPATHSAPLDNRGTKAYACKTHAELWNAGKLSSGASAQRPTTVHLPWDFDKHGNRVD